MKDFFISYTSVDKAWAEWIAWQLEEAGYQVVIQAWDFHPGSNFVLEMQNAAAQSERTIAVLSPDFPKSLYTQPEWAAAFAQDPNGKKGTLIPVRVRACELTGLLSQIIYVNLVGLKEKDAADALLQSIKSERVKPANPPGFPGTFPEHTFPSLLPFPGASQSPASQLESAKNMPPDPIAAARIRDLEHHVREGLKLLKQFEEKLRLSDNPKEQARSRKEIKALQSQLRSYQKELDQLTGKKPSTSSEPAHVVNIHTGGGAYIAGDIKVERGDFVGRDKVDRSISVGDISGSTGVAIGGDAHTGGPTPDETADGSAVSPLPSKSPKA